MIMEEAKQENLVSALVLLDYTKTLICSRGFMWTRNRTSAPSNHCIESLVWTNLLKTCHGVYPTDHKSTKKHVTTSRSDLIRQYFLHWLVSRPAVLYSPQRSVYFCMCLFQWTARPFTPLMGTKYQGQSMSCPKLFPYTHQITGWSCQQRWFGFRHWNTIDYYEPFLVGVFK